MRVHEFRESTNSNRRDSGMAMIWFAAVATMLIGMGALVVDYGALLSERRQLQNGADAAVLAAAIDCAVANCVGATTSAMEYAKSNVNDSLVDVSVCGKAAGMASTCAPEPPGVGSYNYLQAKTSTRTSKGQIIEYVLAPVIEGAGKGKTVKASATAIWGTVGAANVKAFVLPSCLVPAGIGSPGYDPKVGTVYLRASGKAFANCPGTALPSAFDFANPDAGGDGCSVSIEIKQQSDGSYYAEAEQKSDGWIPDCKSSILKSAKNNDTVLIPVASDVLKIGTKTFYKIDGFISIEVCGFHLGEGKDAKDPDFLYDQCGAGDCISGTGEKDKRICGILRRVALSDAKLGNGKNYGTYVVKMVG